MPEWLAERFASYLRGMGIDRLLVEIRNFDIYSRTAYVDFLVMNENNLDIGYFSHLFFGPTDDEKKLLTHIPHQKNLRS